MSFVQQVQHVFGHQPEITGEGGYRRTLQILVACSRQLAALGVKVRLSSSEIWITLPWMKGNEYLMATTTTPRAAVCAIADSDLQTAQHQPTLLASNSPQGLALCMPVLQHTDPEKQRAGERLLKLFCVPIGERMHMVPILVAPNLLPLRRGDTELVMHQKMEQGREKEWRLIGTWCDQWLKLANMLCRDAKDAQGNGYSETSILKRYEDERCPAKELFPNPLAEREGSLMTALSDAIQRLSRPRIEGGINVLIIGDSALNVDEISFPFCVAKRMAREAARMGSETWVTVGSEVLLTRRPIAIPPIVRIAKMHTDTQAIRIHPWLAAVLESDFDGDSVDIKPVPRESDVQFIRPSVIFKTASHTDADVTWTAAWPKAHTLDQDGINNAVRKLVEAKGLVGMGTVLYRVKPNLVDVLRHMDFRAIEIDERRLSATLHEKIVPEMVEPLRHRLHDFGSLAGRLIMEALVSKRDDVSYSIFTELLDKAHKNPYEALAGFMKLGGIFADNRFEMAMTCLYLKTLPLPFSELMDTAPAVRKASTLSVANWKKDVPAVLEALNAIGTRVIFE